MSNEQTSFFSHESIVYCPQSHTLKYLRKYFRFTGDIYEIRVFSYQFPGNETQQLWKVKYFQFFKGFIVFFVLTFGQFLGLVTQKFPGICYPEVEFCEKKLEFFLF